jgi:hypothetical protein
VKPHVIEVLRRALLDDQGNHVRYEHQVRFGNMCCPIARDYEARHDDGWLVRVHHHSVELHASFTCPECDEGGDEYELSISYCPFCGREYRFETVDMGAVRGIVRTAGHHSYYDWPPWEVEP